MAGGLQTRVTKETVIVENKLIMQRGNLDREHGQHQTTGYEGKGFRRKQLGRSNRWR
jgi:hypothetical protein